MHIQFRKGQEVAPGLDFDGSSISNHLQRSADCLKPTDWKQRGQKLLKHIRPSIGLQLPYFRVQNHNFLQKSKENEESQHIKAFRPKTRNKTTETKGKTIGPMQIRNREEEVDDYLPWIRFVKNKTEGEDMDIAWRSSGKPWQSSIDSRTFVTGGRPATRFMPRTAQRAPSNIWPHLLTSRAS